MSMTRSHQEWVDLLTQNAGVEAPLDVGTEPVPAAALREFFWQGSPPRLALESARIVGDLDLSHVSYSHPLRFDNCFVEGTLNLASAKLSQISLTNTHLNGLEFGGAVIDGDARFTGLQVTGEVEGIGAHITGDLFLRDASLQASDEGLAALALDGARVGRAIQAQNIRVAGQFRAIGIRVGGQLTLSGAQLEEVGGTALLLDGAEIDFGLFANDGFRAAGSVRAIGARIGRYAAFDGARVASVGDDALALDRSTIAGLLDLNGATLINPDADALSIENAEINGGVFCGDNFHASGRFRAAGIHIRGPLYFEDATLTNPGSVALGLEGAEISLGLFTRGTVTFVGQIEAPALHTGQLDLEGCRITNPDGYALRLDGAKIDGDFFARGGFTTTGEVGASGIHVAGRLIIAGATLTNRGYVVSLGSAEIQHLVLGRLSVQGRFDLTRAKLDELEIIADPPGELIATGWEVGDLRGRLHKSWHAVDRWLATAPQGIDSVQPWHALADVYEKNGNPYQARRLRFAAANRLTSQAPRWPRWTGYGYRLLVGHGYYPRRAAAWLALVLLATGIIVDNWGRTELVPTRASEALAAAEAQASRTHTPPPTTAPTAAMACGSYPDYPCMQPLNFTLMNLLPIAGAAPSTTDWAARSDTWLAAVLLLSKFATWALAALLLAGVTNLLKKT